jgi:PIN domain nuclease of toxin-antitoxin system
MSYLLDTQILIWFQLSDKKLKSHIYDLLAEKVNTVFVSQISLFEIAIKQKIGKLPELNIPISILIQLIREDDFTILPVHEKHIAAYDSIPLLNIHKDPFDRLLLATAFAENIPIISADENFPNYIPQIQLITA